MGKFDNFNKKVDLNQINKQMEAAAKDNGTGDFPEIEAGNYRVKLVKMEVGSVKSGKNTGAPILKVDFKIIENPHKNCHLFMNKVLYTDRTDDNWNMGKLMKNVIGWLDTLEPSDDIPPITFEDYDQFADLILDIASDVSSLEYDVKYEPDAFNAITIEEVYE